MRRSFRSIAAAILLALMPAAALAQALPSPKVTTRPANDNSDVAASTRYVDLSAQILLNAIASKAPIASPTFTGTVGMPALDLKNGTITGVTGANTGVGAVASGLYLDANNVAVRAPAASGTIFFQSTGGSQNWGFLNSGGLSINGAVQSTGFFGPAGAATVTATGAAGNRTLADLAGFVAGNTPTIATLRSLSVAPLVSNVSVNVSGYYAAADGGGGTFTWAPASTAADDGGSVIKPTAVSSAGRWLRVVNGPFSIKMFGARGDGVADDGPIIRTAYVASTALGRRVLSCPAGTYSLATRVFLTSGVALTGGRDCVMRAADNGSDILFEVYEANDVGFEGITIDGNRDNNSANYSRNNKALIHLRSAANSFVRGVAFKDGPGIGVAGYGDNVDVSNNDFSNIRDRAIFHTGSADAYAKNFTARNNRINGSFSHAINIGYAEAFDVSNNAISGHVIGLRSTMRVNVSGATVTFFGGPENFRNVKPGEFLVMDHGKEWDIVAKVNDTTITLGGQGANKDQFPPNGNNQVAMVGSGDLFGMESVRNGKAQGNQIGNTATFGSGIISSGGAVTNVLFANNFTYRTGKHGLLVSAEAQGATNTRVKLIGNAFDEAGAGSDAVSDFERTSVAISAGPGSVTGVSIEGTVVTSDTASYGPVLNWLGFDLNMQAGTVTLGKSNVSTASNGKAIANDVKSITLSPKWGSSATASSIVSTGDRVDFKIVAGGTGFDGYPGGTISKVSDVGPQPAVQSFLRSSAGPGDIRFPIVVDNATAGNWPFTWTSGDKPAAPGGGADPTTFVTSFVAN